MQRTVVPMVVQRVVLVPPLPVVVQVYVVPIQKQRVVLYALAAVAAKIRAMVRMVFILSVLLVWVAA